MADEKNTAQDVEEEVLDETIDDTTETTEGVDEADTDSSEAVETAESDEADDENIPEDRKSFFKKKDKKDKKDLQIEELTDKYRRTMAEFDNFRKRTEKEKSAMYEIGARDIIEKLLPVVDNFERGLASIPEDAQGTPVADGMNMIYRQLAKMLEDAGVKEIEAQGQEFDPNLHNAVMHVDDEELGDNVVAEVLQKGYTYKDSVVRHSMVKVAN